MGLRFKVVKPRYEETNHAHLAPGPTVRRHALGKALSAAASVRDGVILGADTVVYLDGRLIGKPKNRKDAVKMLAGLQGRSHTVYTGVALLKMAQGKVAKRRVFVEKTAVFIRPMTRAEILSYFKRINPLDKAGAYAIQSRRTGIVSAMKGSLWNAAGLPAESLAKHLLMVQ